MNQAATGNRDRLQPPSTSVCFDSSHHLRRRCKARFAAGVTAVGCGARHAALPNSGAVPTHFSAPLRAARGLFVVVLAGAAEAEHQFSAARLAGLCEGGSERCVRCAICALDGAADRTTGRSNRPPTRPRRRDQQRKLRQHSRSCSCRARGGSAHLSLTSIIAPSSATGALDTCAKASRISSKVPSLISSKSPQRSGGGSSL